MKELLEIEEVPSEEEIYRGPPPTEIVVADQGWWGCLRV